VVSQRKRLFIAMPFKRDFDAVLRVIKEAAALLNAEAIHLGEEAFVGSITTRICNTIDEADALVAIATEENGNVYYEIGLAHCQRKPVVILTSDPMSLKFDLRDHRALIYDSAHPEAARDELVRTIAAALIPLANPTEYLANAFRGVSPDSQKAYDAGLKKAKETVAAQLGLADPVEVTVVHYHAEKRELALEVRDFMGTRARALVDINGIIRSIKKVSR
jgi:hypothetical protein